MKEYEKYCINNYGTKYISIDTLCWILNKDNNEIKAIARNSKIKEHKFMGFDNVHYYYYDFLSIIKKERKE